MQQEITYSELVRKKVVMGMNVEGKRKREEDQRR